MVLLATRTVLLLSTDAVDIIVAFVFTFRDARSASDATPLYAAAAYSSELTSLSNGKKKGTVITCSITNHAVVPTPAESCSLPYYCQSTSLEALLAFTDPFFSHRLTGGLITADSPPTFTSGT